MGLVKIEGIDIYAFHGCLPEEAKVGRKFVVDVQVELDLMKAAENDDLTQTVDYCVVYDTVKAEMQIRSKLIETVALRIAQKLKSRYPQCTYTEVKVTKLHPPVNGDVDRASATIRI